MNERRIMSADESPMLAISHIKKEVDGSGFPTCSPTNSNLYSPTTTVLPNDMDYCDPHETGGYQVQQQRSPGSPDRQFCSSTTQFVGDVNISNVEGEIKEEDLPRRLCLVCGDIASGFHYGVASCEACKAFFKRTIQGNIEYTCPAANDCEINKRRRKACQACRFQKCLRMGMLKEGVRLDRVRGGRQKYRRNTDAPYQMQSLPPLKPYLSLEDNKILEALALNEPDMSIVAQDISNVDPGLRTLNILSDIYDQELVKIITWAKHIPGFLDLTLNDQMRLLQSTWAEILTLTVTYRSIPGTGELKFAADFSLDEKMARECNALDLYQHCMHIVERQEKLNITKEEYYIIKALVLANSDVRIDDLPPLKKLRDNILSALADCIAVIRPNSTPLHMNHLLLCLPALRQADHINRRFWSSVHREGKVYMNKLFVEMLESYIR